MTYKPVDTAIIMMVGPCIDDTDFKSLEEAIAYNAAGMDISLIVEKTDGTSAVTAITLTTGGTSDWTHKDGGYYEVEITAAQNAEEGIAYLRGICTGVLPFESPRYDIVKANIYDSLIKGTDTLQVDAIEVSGDSTAADNLELDYDGTGYDKSNSTIGTCTSTTDMRGTDSANTVVPDVAGTAATLHGVTDGIINTIDGKVDTIDGNVDSILVDTGTDGVLLATTATSAQLVDNVWDEVLTGVSHNVGDSSGKRLREMFDAGFYEEETAQSGAAETITLATTADSNNDFYNMMVIHIIDGTGIGQSRTLYNYNGTTKIANVCENWVITPDNTSKYIISAHACVGVFTMKDGVYNLINVECDTALTDYDPPTRAESTVDTNSIITEVNANETKIDIIDINVDSVLVDTGTTIPGTISTLQSDSTAIKAKTDNLPSGITKNVALSDFSVLMVLSSDGTTAATGKTVVCQISKDGSAFVVSTNSVTEISDGMYKVDLTQTEMNADAIILRFTNADCMDRLVVVYPS